MGTLMLNGISSAMGSALAVVAIAHTASTDNNETFAFMTPSPPQFLVRLAAPSDVSNARVSILPGQWSWSARAGVSDAREVASLQVLPCQKSAHLGVA
jgi:hypothetical protein